MPDSVRRLHPRRVRSPSARVPETIRHVAAVNVSRVPRRTKDELAQEVADHLGLPAPIVSNGATVVSTFLDDVHRALSLGPTSGKDAYRKVEAVFEGLGLTYDPHWDSSEHSETGGSTVTARAYSRMLSALTGEPRCFLVPADLREGSELHFTNALKDHSTLHEAGPGAALVLYERHESQIVAMATAVLGDVTPGWRSERWIAGLEALVVLAEPVEVRVSPPVGEANAAIEIKWSDLEAIARHAGSDRIVPVEAVNDPGGAEAAWRVLDDFDIPVLDVSVPTAPDATASLPEIKAPVYGSDKPSEPQEPQQSFHGRTASGRASDRVAELRAVRIVTASLEATGWEMTRDRQQDGCGYDLEFSRDDRTIHVEVKGIQGPDLRFNLTPKERWRCQTDDDWLVLAVTSVLSPREPRIHAVTREQLKDATWTVTGYRVILAR